MTKILLAVCLLLLSSNAFSERKPLTTPQPYQQRTTQPIKLVLTGNLSCVIKPVMSDEDLKACKS